MTFNSWDPLVYAFNAAWLEEAGDRWWLRAMWTATGPLAAAVFLGGSAAETLLVLAGLCHRMELETAANAARLYAGMQSSRDLAGLLAPSAALLETETGERRVALQVLWCGQHTDTPAGHQEAARFTGEALCGVVRVALKKCTDARHADVVRGRFVYALARALEEHPRAPRVSPLDVIWPLLQARGARFTLEELGALDDAERARLFDATIAAFAAEGGITCDVPRLDRVLRDLRARVQGVSS